MTNSTLRRWAAAAAFVAFVAFLGTALAGCTATSGGAASPQSAMPAPKVGDCWTTSFSASQKTEDWEGAAAVSCSTVHQTYTYAVAKMGKKFSYRSWLTSKGTVRADVDLAAHDACVVQQKRLLPAYSVKEARLVPTYYLPSVAQWAAGARWVRCDVGLIKIGSLVSAPNFAPLPAFALLQQTLKSDPTTYALCEDDPANNGPDGAETTYANCKGAADYTFLAQLTMSGGSGAAYPGLTALTKSGQAQCATLKTPAGHLVVAEPPAQLDWTKYDDRQLDCWLNNN